MFHEKIRQVEERLLPVLSRAKSWKAVVRERWYRLRSSEYHIRITGRTKYKAQLRFGLLFPGDRGHTFLEKGDTILIDDGVVSVGGKTGLIENIQAAIRDHWVSLWHDPDPPAPIFNREAERTVVISPLTYEEIPEPIRAKIEAEEPLTVEEMSWMWDRAVPVYREFKIPVPEKMRVFEVKEDFFEDPTSRRQEEPEIGPADCQEQEQGDLSAHLPVVGDEVPVKELDGDPEEG